MNYVGQLNGVTLKVTHTNFSSNSSLGGVCLLIVSVFERNCSNVYSPSFHHCGRIIK